MKNNNNNVLTGGMFPCENLKMSFLCTGVHSISSSQLQVIVCLVESI